MTKPDFQKELLEKVKPGTKPSHLKKLKRSKSADDIPKTPLSKSPSHPPSDETKYPYTTLVSQQEELERLEKETETKSTTISLLRKKIEDLETQLKNNPPTQLLQDQLTEKQSQIELLRQQLESKPNLTELDNSLFARHKNLKDWFSQYSKNKKLDSELLENIEEASQELITQDQTIGQLRGQISQLKLTNQSLQKDLNLVTKLAEMRKNPLPNPETDTSYLKNILIGLFLVLWFSSLLNNSWNNNFKDN